MCLCSSSASLICFSIEWSGLSEVIGSWKIIEILLPLTPRRTLSEAPISSSSRKRMLPVGWLAIG